MRRTIKIQKADYLAVAKLILMVCLFVPATNSFAGDIYLTNGNKGAADGSSWANGKDAATYLNGVANNTITVAANTNIYIAGGVSYTVPGSTQYLKFNNDNILVKGGYNPAAPYNYNPTQFITILQGTTSGSGYPLFSATTTDAAKTVTFQGLDLRRGHTNSSIISNPNNASSTGWGGQFKFVDCQVVNQDGSNPLFWSQRFTTGSSLSFSNCYFEGNDIGTSGSVIFASSNLTGTNAINIEGCSFKLNSTSPGNYGATLNVTSSSTSVTIKSSTYCNNTAQYGGAIGLQNLTSTLSIDGSTFANNTASVSGGAVNVERHGVVIITNTKFYGNVANGGLIGYGGAINDQMQGSTANGAVTLTNVDFYNNRVNDGFGGAVATNTGSAAYASNWFLNNCKFVANVSGSSTLANNFGKGGAVYFTNIRASGGFHDMTFNGCIFYRNHGGDNNYTKNGADFIADTRNDAGVDSKIKTSGTQSKVQGVSAAAYQDYNYFTNTGYDFSGSAPLYSNNTDDGSVGTPTFTCPTGINAVAVNVTGQVWDDVNGNVALDPTENGTNAGGPLYVNLVDATGTVVASTTVSATGSYTLSAPVSTSGLKLVLTNSATATTPGSLPSQWVNTGESVGPGNSASQSSTLGQIELTTGTTDATAQNFGIEHLPVPGSGTATVSNPGGTTPVTVPPAAFTSTSPANDNGDTPPGSVTAIKLTVFPSNVTSLTVNGTVYTSLPAGGITIPTNGNGAPTVPILVDPTNDSQPVVFTYTAIDNAGKESITTGMATLNFTGVPDLVPIIYALPATQYGTTNTTVVVDVFELNNVSTSGLITVYVSKDPLVSLIFNSTATLVGGRPVNNSSWTFDNTNPNFYIFTTNQVISGGDVKSLGLTGVTTPGNTQGVLTLSTTIVGGSGGESRIDNNSDADEIDYFKK